MKWLTENVKAVIAFTVIFFSFSYFTVITFTDVKADPQIIIAIVGALTTVLAYYFGSSQGNNKKDEIIANMSTNPVAQTTSGDINVAKETPTEFKIEPEN